MSGPSSPREGIRKSSGPAEMSSVVTNDMLALFRTRYHFPSDLVLQLPTKLERITLPPAGFFGIYEMTLLAGVRFPLPTELVAILLTCGISVSQLSCRATTIIMGLIVFFRERKAVLTPEILYRICRLIPDSQGRATCRSKMLDLRVKDPPRNWTGRFFFVQNEWKIRERWGNLKELPSSLQVGDEDVLRVLGLSSVDDFQYEVRFLGKILEEDRLFKVGISIQSGRSEAFLLKRSKKIPSPVKKATSKVLPPPRSELKNVPNSGKEATSKVPLPPRSEGARSLVKRKAVVQLAAGQDSAVVDLSLDSPKSRMPDHVAKRSCTGMLQAIELVSRKENLLLELKDVLKEWNTEFVRTKFWLGEYKQAYLTKKEVITDLEHQLLGCREELVSLEHQLSGCRDELASLLSSYSERDQEVIRVRDEVTEVQTQADDMKKNYKALEAKVQELEKKAEAGSRALEDFKKSVEFKMIIQEHVEMERDHILDFEVNKFEQRGYEEGFIRGFLKATRVVNRQTGAEIEGISPSQASEDPPSDVGDEVESVAESEEVDYE